MTIKNNQNGTYTIDANEEEVTLMHMSSEVLLLNLSLAGQMVTTEMARKVIDYNEALSPHIEDLEIKSYSPVEKTE